MRRRGGRRDEESELYGEAAGDPGEEAVELDEVLEPYADDAEGADDYGADGYGADDYIADDYDDEPEEADGRFRVAMSVFNVVSILVGIMVILLLSALLISLVSWLTTDIRHSFVLMQSNLQ